MEIKFLSDKAFNSGYTLLFGHNYVFDTYKSEKVMKFFYPEMLEKSKNMLASRDIVEGSDYTVVD
jgi:hypothetical protein